jgi:hypothetical protein
VVASKKSEQTGDQVLDAKSRPSSTPFVRRSWSWLLVVVGNVVTVVSPETVVCVVAAVVVVAAQLIFK